MKVQLIVVDKIPEHCLDCQFMSHSICTALNIEFPLLWWEEYKDKYCPLELAGD